MSDEEKPAIDAAKDGGKRRPVAIDLPKEAVKEIAAETSAPSTAAPAAPEPADGQAEKPKSDPVKSDPVKSYIEAKLDKPVEMPTPPAAPARAGKATGLFSGAIAGGLFGALAAYGYGMLNPHPAPIPDPRIATLESALGGIDKRLNTANPEIVRVSGALKLAEERILALDSRPPAVPKVVEERLTGLDALLASVRTQAGDALKKIEGIEKLAPASPAEAGAAQSEAPRVDLAPIAARIVRIEAALAESGTRAETATAALATMGARLKDTEQALAAVSRPKASEFAGVALPLAAMARRSLDAGEPLGPVVAALKALGTADDILRPLAVFSDSAAPRPGALATAFAEQLAKVPPPATPTQAAKDMSISDRLKANIATLVEVRPTGSQAAPAASTRVDEARAQLLAGDLDGFAKSAAGLPEGVRGALGPVIAAAARRNDAITAIAALESAALAAAVRRN